MLSNTPLVSVLLIAMNHEKFIQQACESILNQTYHNIEVIFLDNCSKDKTFEIADTILKSSKIKYTGLKNTQSKGVSENLNILVDHANGEYISILSGDDWYINDNIEKRINFLKKNNLDVVLADGFKFIESKQQQKDVYSSKRKVKVIKTIQNYYEINLVNNITCNVGFFTKKEILLKHKFDVLLHTEDWDINLRLSKAGYKFGFLDKKTFYYRVLNTSLSHNSDLMKQSFIQVTNKNLVEIQSNPYHLKSYNMRLLDFEILRLENKNNLIPGDVINLHLNKVALNNLKYNGIKRIFKNFLLSFKK